MHSPPPRGGRSSARIECGPRLERTGPDSLAWAQWLCIPPPACAEAWTTLGRMGPKRTPALRLHKFRHNHLCEHPARTQISQCACAGPKHVIPLLGSTEIRDFGMEAGGVQNRTGGGGPYRQLLTAPDSRASATTTLGLPGQLRRAARLGPLVDHSAVLRSQGKQQTATELGLEWVWGREEPFLQLYFLGDVVHERSPSA